MWRSWTNLADGWSLQRRLTGLLVGALGLLAIGLYLVLAGYAERAADRAYDRLLLASALAIGDAVRVEEGEVTVDLPYAALAILGSGRRDRVFYRVLAPGGALITGYPDLAERLPPAASGEPRFADIVWQGTTLRAAVLGRFVAGAGRNGWATIVVAHTRDERSLLANEILANAFAPLVVMVAAATLLIWLGVRRALAPLAMLERLIRGRDPGDLSPIEAPVPKEVRQLLGALNGFMQRLQASMRFMQTFLADAAHQIRTPLASLRAQAELAVEEDDPGQLRRQVERIHKNAAVASQLTNQLLSHAMVTHRHELRCRQPVDLAHLLEQVAGRAAAGGEGSGVVLDREGLEGPAVVWGDPVALREAIANLADNALKYAGEHGPIELRLARRATGATIRLEVADQGPGIPDGEKRRVLERFSRGTTAGTVVGSGLGLAIAHEVALAHNGTLTLLDRPGGGLVARLDLPAMPVEAGAGRASRAAAALITLLLGLSEAHAAEAILYPALASEEGRLRIHAATDLAAMQPLLTDFQAIRPGIAIEYLDLDTIELHASVVRAANGAVPDLVISSAMDLQAKLVNDGWTQPHVSDMTARVPAWANWRDEAFGFTFEPAVIVHHRDLAAAEVPRSRADLARLLRDRPDRYRWRVATYDIARSGVGYLFATQDSVLTSQFWRLMLAFGEASAQLYPNSAAMLDAVQRGDVLLAYNVLGSYARARQQAGAPIGIVLPEDYTLVMSRVVTIPKAARQPALAKLFLDYLLSERGQAVVAGAAGLQALVPASSTPSPLPDALGPIHPIQLGSPLLVFLDPLKRQRFLADWTVTVHPP